MYLNARRRIDDEFTFPNNTSFQDKGVKLIGF